MFYSEKRSAIITSLPMIFIIGVVICILGYHGALRDSIAQLHSVGVKGTTDELLKKADFNEIPGSLALATYYLGIFVFAEAAFVLMAIREYLQDVLHLDETELLKGTICFSQPLDEAGRARVTESA